uniref:tRNA pseudouridine(38/39) synthase-like n=1 Tax=Styela clava TaxID=7725 RepID=UPI00193A8BFD|nr:tRNA pseudouridine(38/39) synthase-like [Styela clava]
MNIFDKWRHLVLKPKFQTRISWNFCRKKNGNFETKEELEAHKESLRRYNKASYDYEYLFNLQQSQLVYKIIRMQRQIDSYTVMKSINNVDGRDKIRVEHPDIEDIVDHYDYNLRRVAFKVAYLGWDYMGYAWSDNTDRGVKGHTNVVERVFMEALLRQQLVRKLSYKNKFDRCGRTDKNVSGLGQVICVNVRSNMDHGYGVWGQKNWNNSNKEINEPMNIIDGKTTEEKNWDDYDISDKSRDSEEIPYIKLLNEALPMDIRVLAWSPVSKGFSPRKSCLSRTYRYFVPLGGLDVNLMKKCAKKLVGEHDFINFAKLSADNMESQTVRQIKNFDIEILPRSNSSLRECNICQFTVTGSGFLYRQVRFMVSVLCLIGNGHEDPSVIERLLDIENTQGRPSYSSASASPLILYDSEYSSDDIDWRWDEEALKTTAHSIAGIWCENAMKSEITRTIYGNVVSKLSSEKRDEIINSVQGSLLHYDAATIFRKIYDSDVAKTQQQFKDVEKLKTIRRLQRKGLYKAAAQMHGDDGYENVGWKS